MSNDIEIDPFAEDVPSRVGEHDSIERMRSQAVDRANSTRAEDEANVTEDYDLPGAYLGDEELWVPLVPQQPDEFTCTRCYLVVHRSRRVSGGSAVCKDCS